MFIFKTIFRLKPILASWILYDTLCLNKSHSITSGPRKKTRLHFILAFKRDFKLTPSLFQWIPIYYSRLNGIEIPIQIQRGVVQQQNCIS